MNMFQIIDFTPQEGDAGARLQVRTRVAQTASRVFLRLVVGNIAVATEIYDEGYDGVWRLEGDMPPSQSPSPFVSLTVQAVNQENHVLDQETLGTFKYLSAPHMAQQSPHRQSRSRVSSVSSNYSNTAVGIPLSMADAAAAARRGSIASTMSGMSSLSNSSGTYGPGHHAPSSNSNSIGNHRRILRRREPGDDDPAERVVIDFATPIDDLGRNLTEEERALGRRLVRFECELIGNRLIISGRAIRQDDYIEDDQAAMYISCIYRPGAETTYFTSVDVIELLAYLADDKFKVEEKNRIRRNLEGFHPTTISKNKANLEAFFTQIMEFPTPKPRNIEKDVKVFTWETLSLAIDKIISKYSIVHVNELDSSESPSSQVLPDSGTLLSMPSQYHDPNASLYGPPSTLLGGGGSSYGSSYHTASGHFDNGSGSDQGSEHEYALHPVPGGYAQPQPLYHGPVDGAYNYGSIDYGHAMRTVPSQLEYAM